MAQRHTEDDLVRTLPRMNSLDSDDDGSLAGSPLAGSLRNRPRVLTQDDMHTLQSPGNSVAGSSPDDKRLQHASGHLHSNGLQTPPDGVQDRPDQPGPSLASRMLSPFAAFALQTHSRSRSLVPGEHDGVT